MWFTHKFNQCVKNKRKKVRKLWAKTLIWVQDATHPAFLAGVLISSFKAICHKLYRVMLWLRGGHCSKSVQFISSVDVHGRNQRGSILLSPPYTIGRQLAKADIWNWVEVENWKQHQGWLSPASGIRKSNLSSKWMLRQHQITGICYSDGPRIVKISLRKKSKFGWLTLLCFKIYKATVISPA